MNWFTATWQNGRDILALKRQLATDRARLAEALTAVPVFQRDVATAVTRWQFKSAPYLSKNSSKTDTK